MSSLGVLILTHNEERHIERSIRSLAGLASDIVVVDSYSTDRTVELARAAGARVLQNRWTNYAAQFQWGLDAAGFATDWVMRLDADEIIEPALVEEIRLKLPTLRPGVEGVVLKRKHIFMGRFIRHGGRYPLYLLRIWRNGAAHIEQRWMDEHMVLDRGRSVVFDAPFADVNLNDLSFFTDKHNKYATREAIDVLGRRHSLFRLDSLDEQSSRQAKLRRLVKERVYNRLGFVGPVLYFAYRMVFQLGFLDGREGFIYHFLQGCWYRFLVAAKLDELERALRPLSSREDKLAELERLTGLRLASADSSQPMAMSVAARR